MAQRATAATCTTMRAVDISGLDLSRARLAGAHLEGARLAGAHLERANFTDAVVQYASVKSSDLSTSNLDLDQVTALFGDGSVTDAMLPPGVTRPAHRPEADLDLSDLLGEWLKWKVDPEG